MSIISRFSIILIILGLSACGGGGSSDTPTPTPNKSTISITSIALLAIEKSHQFAKFEIKRTGQETTAAIEITFNISENSALTKGSTSPSDYQLIYSDGGQVGDTLILKNGQNSRVIEVQPILDELHEVPETLVINLSSSEKYILADDKSAQITIIDAENTRENAKVFIGIFAPQNGATTNGTGVLSFILQGDNEQGLLSYTFSNLTSVQTDQHIHLSPSGNMIKDIESKGNITNYLWDLAPGGIFVTEQQMLDALFNGEFFLNIHTANYSGGEISAAFIFDENIKPPEEVTLSENAIDRDIIRFLTQATFGAIPEDYQVLRSQITDDGSNRLQVYQAWIEEQLQVEQTSLLALTNAIVPHFPEEVEVDWEWRIRRDAFWPIAVYGKDQLRQRMAFALSEILVIGDDDGKIRDTHRGVAQYWDLLAENAFGHYNEALYDATLHPIMGYWLSHLKNRKENSALGFFPDENFAREIMQLFSIGLVHRELNGTIKLGADNLPIPTYDNETITNMAKVFTGLSFSHQGYGNTKLVNNDFDLGIWTYGNQYRWTEPMKYFAEPHEFDQKTLFTDNGITLVIPEMASGDAHDAEQELLTVINALVAHKSAAPFIAKQLIQRFVTSNPSPEYIERVATAFGSTGDLNATIKAILLDNEARNPNAANSKYFGKIKEQVLQMTSLMRLFQASSKIPLDNKTNGLNLPSSLTNNFSSAVTLLRMGDQNIGQRVLGSPSVFNFFSPDYSPAGDLAKNSLVSPELQLVTESQLFTNLNTYHRFLSGGFKRWKVEEYSQYTADQLTVRFNESLFNNLWQSTPGSNTDKATAMVDYLDFYFNAGQLKQSSNQVIRNTLIAGIADLSDNERFKESLYIFLSIPDLAVQR